MHTGIHYCQCANHPTIRQIRDDLKKKNLFILKQVFINDPRKSKAEMLRTGSNYYLKMVSCQVLALLFLIVYVGVCLLMLYS